MNWQDIGLNARELAAEQGRSMSDVCTKAGLGKSYVTNKAANPTLESVQKLADSLDCSWRHLLRERMPRKPLPPKNKRIEVPALKDTGTDIPKVFRLWADYDGRLTPGFIRDMEKLDMWRMSQLYNYEEGLYIYGWLGDFFIQTLGTWALEAPGNIVGERDPDPQYAKFTMWIWDRVMSSDIPRRYAMLVRSFYDPGSPCHSFEAFYAPMLKDDKRYLLVAVQMVEEPVG